MCLITCVKAHYNLLVIRRGLVPQKVEYRYWRIVDFHRRSVLSILMYCIDHRLSFLIYNIHFLLQWRYVQRGAVSNAIRLVLQLALYVF